ncbi:MAG: D-isomer specific 2-hydroxyacid dehydrogenase family protein [Christensenellales bacterium]|jgi:lactate dehydrogenase-like 2-hydroxyacid dehydrogenase
MKILAYSYRQDETEYFQKFSEKYQVDIMMCKDAPSLNNAHLAKGCACISIITTPIGAALLKKFYQAGVRYISTRTIGYEHIDIKYADQIGIDVGNITYSPGSVADYTVMLMLMAIRKIKAIMARSQVQDYSLRAVRGRELKNMTVGVIGTGRIGQAVIKNLSGFGSRLLAYDLLPNEKAARYAVYVSLEELLEQSDIITLHVPADENNVHLINNETIARMKDGVCIINTARGSLIDTQALIDGIEQKKIGSAALDVIENETALYYNDLKCEVLKNRELAVLNSYPNVIVTPHTAFFTDQAVSDMVENSILNCSAFMKNHTA